MGGCGGQTGSGGRKTFLAGEGSGGGESLDIPLLQVCVGMC